MASSWPTWKKCWKPTQNRRIPRARCSAWTSSPCNWSRRPEGRSRPPRSIPGGSITSTSGRARPRFSCSPSPSPDGGWRPRGSRRRRSIGHSKWPGCSTVVTKGCDKVILVCDNLNTHTKGAFYEAFPPAQARQYVRRIEFCHTPKHGSWLNIAENELSSMTRQCIAGRRIGDLKPLREQIRAWSNDVNRTQRGVDWQMRINDARRSSKTGTRL